jgi:hypothetical protein
MNDFMATANRREYLVPFPFNVRAIGVQHCFQLRFSQHLLAGCHIRGQGDADADGNNAQIKNHVHERYMSATFYPVSSLIGGDKLSTQRADVHYTEFGHLACQEAIAEGLFPPALTCFKKATEALGSFGSSQGWGVSQYNDPASSYHNLLKLGRLISSGVGEWFKAVI